MGEETHVPVTRMVNRAASDNSRNDMLGSSGSETDEEDEVSLEDEDDVEKITVISLFDDAKFNNLPAMLAHLKTSFDFDLPAVQKRLNLDYLGMVKLVNFIRTQVKEGHGRSLDLSTASAFDDDRYLLPVLEDDALLYSLEDIAGCDLAQFQGSSTASPVTSGFEEGTAAYTKISELHEALMRSQQGASKALQRLEIAEAALNLSRNVDMEKLASPSQSHSASQRAKYKGNYDGPELHRTMIADKARTETYRNFILQNPHLFRDKVVLDVGCGTSILSLFCAEAGAKAVYAVDQSESIINKAREIVFRNGKQETIKLISGRIQDISLPVKQVDIIVSEWMGYCLLYEAMFDSVIYARDRYLTSGGLMVPALSTLYIAPFSHPEYRKSRIEFWDDVYGYNMGCFKPDVLKDVDVDANLSESHLLSSKHPFLTLDLYIASVSDLSFRGKPFSCNVAQDVMESLDGFAIWFDVDFSAPASFIKLTLSTGPEDLPTHWRQGLCLIDRKREDGVSNRVEGMRIDGEISYEKEGDDTEGLDITIKWRMNGNAESKQVWFLH